MGCIEIGRSGITLYDFLHTIVCDKTMVFQMYLNRENVGLLEWSRSFFYIHIFFIIS